MDLLQKGCEHFTIMQDNPSKESLYLNDFHRADSMAALREVQQMILHPYSREQKIAQIRANKANSTSKQGSNMQRDKLHR